MSNKEKQIIPDCPHCKQSLLLPCPFCNSMNLKLEGDDPYIECLTCHSMGPLGNDSIEAIKKWNERIKG